MEDLLLLLWENLDSPINNYNCCYEVIPALLTAAATLGATTLQDMFNKKNIEDARDYNTPDAQMKRIKAAGLNPALYYSGKQVENISQPVESPDIPSALNSAVSGVVQHYTVKNLKEQNENLKMQNKVLAADAKSREIDNKVKEVQSNLDLQRLSALDDAYIYFDESGNSTIGTMDSEGKFEPLFNPDGSISDNNSGYYKMSYYEGYRQALRNGFQANSEYFMSKMNQIESALKEKFGDRQAKALIRQLNSAAYSAREQGRNLQLDNDFFENIHIGDTKFGGKSADMALKLLIQILGKK